MNHQGHRKQFRRHHEPGQFHELTFSCYQRRPLLLDDAHCRILSAQLNIALPRWGFLLHAFVLMPEHVHLLVSVAVDAGSLPRFDHLLKSIKRLTSVYVKRRMLADRNPLLHDLTVRERPGVQAFRFWQVGPGYDRNLLTTDSVLASMAYLHDNPVKRGLCAESVDYHWSSASFYATDGQSQSADLPTVSRLSAELFDGPRRS